LNKNLYTNLFVGHDRQGQQFSADAYLWDQSLIITYLVANGQHAIAAKILQFYAKAFPGRVKDGVFYGLRLPIMPTPGLLPGLRKSVPTPHSAGPL